MTLTDIVSPTGGDAEGTASPPVQLEKVVKRYHRQEPPALNEVSVTFPANRITVVVGPSGCGKTTVLRCVSGLAPITSGRILIGDRDVTEVPAEQRGVAMVFQDYALYPHKTVEENIAFPLRMARVTKDERQRRMVMAAALVRIEDYLDRKPGELSGGQRQRVGIARAIVRGPRVLLMDEPLSNLDAKLRNEMRAELGALQRQLGTTTIYVTHDQVEALTLADHLVVLQEGRVEQEGSASEVFNQPATTFVADFMGAMNLLRGMAGDGALWLDGGAKVHLPTGAPLKTGSEMTVGVRPEQLIIGDRPTAGLALSCRRDFVEMLGTEKLAHLWAGDHKIRARVEIGAPIGARLTLTARPEHLHYFDSSGGRIPGAGEGS